MSFEIYVPRPRAGGIKPGQASINACGRLTLTAVDLRRLGITDACVVLHDLGTRRIAIRKPKPGEPTCGVKMNKTKTSGLVNVDGVLRIFGTDSKKARGRFELTSKDDLVYIALPGVEKAR